MEMPERRFYFNYLFGLLLSPQVTLVYLHHDVCADCPWCAAWLCLSED